MRPRIFLRDGVIVKYGKSRKACKIHAEVNGLKCVSNNTR